jgi:hypothetical protein
VASALPPEYQVSEGARTVNISSNEVLDRVKRIETRVTIIGRHLGADVGGGKPVFNRQASRIDIPTRNCSLGEMMKVVPHNWDRAVNVYDGDGSYMFNFTVEPAK